MVEIPEPRAVEQGEKYIHVQYRDPDDFETIRTPEWADDVSDSVSQGSEVRTGKRENSDDWEVQSVLLQKNLGEKKAREQADAILRKIES